MKRRRGEKWEVGMRKEEEEEAMKRRGEEEEVTKKRRVEEEVMKKRRREGWKENMDPRLDLKRTKNQELKRLSRPRSKTRTTVRPAPRAGAGSGCKFGVEIQSLRPEVRRSLIRKTSTYRSIQTKIQTSLQTRTQDSVQTRTQSSVQTRFQSRGSELFQALNQNNIAGSGPTDTELDHMGGAQNQYQRSSSEVLYRSTSNTKKRSDGRRQEPPMTRMKKKKRKIQPSVVRREGQMQLPIASEARRLLNHKELRRTQDSPPDPDRNLNSSAYCTGGTENSNRTSTQRSNHSSKRTSAQTSNQTSNLTSNLTSTKTSSQTSNRISAQTSIQTFNPSYYSSVSNMSRLAVSIMRGSDGFGFTICCDCPVRVQDVDPSGPAHQSGLRQGDSVLQLNGIPVETWKCSELAHAIRSCPSNIVLVLWRGSPEVRSGGDVQRRSPTHNRVAGRKLYPLSSHSKHSHQRGRGLGVLGSLWRDRKEEEEEEEEEEVEQQEEEEQYSSHTTTMKGTRVTSSNGDNYIILSPVNPGGQVMYPNRPRTLDRLYQTHPSRGHHLLHYMEEESSRGTLSGRTATLPPSGPLGSNGNYQNCTIVQSHRPHSGYATYITPHPKTLVFPVFVQPLDLCSPDKTLLMSEEMVLHQINQLPAKVTVLIYTDLLLLTREDVSGRCIVLRSPLYLNMLQLREVPSEPLHLYLLQSSTEGWRCLLSLEAFSIEQKIRVSLCLHDNIHLQLITMETGHTQKLSDRPTDPGQFDPLYSSPSPYSRLCDPLRPPSPSTCYPLSTPARPPSPATYSSGSPFSTPSIPPPLPCPTHCRTVSSPSPSSSSLSSPVWKERAEGEQEERQQGEGESASETSESVGGVRSHSHMEREQEEQFRSTVLRRSLSEGFLLQEPRSPLFLSDSTIDCLTRPETFEPNQFSGPAPPLPSIQALRNQLTQEGGTLNNLLLLFNGTKGSECRNHHQRKKNNRTRVVDACNRLSFLRRRKNNSGYHGNSLEKALRNTRPCAEEVLKWAESLSALLANQYGVAVFRHFLRSEFSEENLDFWLAVEKLKRTSSLSKIAMLGKKIFEEFISTNAARQVNVDSSVRELTNQRLRAGISSTSFHLAQVQVFNLMETDSYPRFLMSSLYMQLANQSTQAACDLANPSKDG